MSMPSPLTRQKVIHGKVTTRKHANEFKRILISSGIPCTIRLRRGIDIQAGCGQLMGKFIIYL